MPKLTSKDVYQRVGKLSKTLRKAQADSIMYMVANLDESSKRTLQSFYGFFIQRLSQRCPMNAMAKLIVAITDHTVVTQARVDKLCAMYVQDSHSAIQSVLWAMRQNAPANIYFPPTGQENAQLCLFPESVTAKLLEGNMDTLIPTYTKVALALQVANEREAAEILAQLYPTAQQGKHVLLPIEEYYYNYLQKWDGRPTPIISILGKYLRYWPKFEQDRLNKALFIPLEKAQVPLPLLQELVYMGHRAEPLFLSLLSKSDCLSPPIYSAVLLFYHNTGIEPPDDLIYRLIITAPAGFLLCTKWAHLVPRIKELIQGEAKLLTPLGDLSEDYALANLPWLGDFTEFIFEHITDNPAPRKITEATLMEHNVDYSEFCNSLLDVLANANLSIDEYLV